MSEVFLILLAAVTFATLLFLSTRFKRCPSDKVLAVYGRVGKGKSVKTFKGGLAFIVPLIQDYAFLDLKPMTIGIPLRGALSRQNIRINVPSTFTIAIDPDPDIIDNAATRLLGLPPAAIEDMAKEIIFGQLRLTVASLEIETLNNDRERFLTEIRKNVDPELRKIGLSLINVNITDITDESGYIDSIGKKAVAVATNQAKIDVAEQDKLGDIGSALADQEKRIQVSRYNSQAVEGENQAKARISSFNADLAEQEAEARRRGQIADQNSIAEIQVAKAKAEAKRLEAEQIVQQEIAKRKVEIAAEAAAEKRRREAQGEADAIMALREAEAKGEQEVLTAKAEGYKMLVAACGGSARDAASMLMVEKLEEIVRLQIEAVKNIKIDKVTVWDSMGGDKGSSTANFLSSMVKSLPAIHDLAEMAGVDLPEYLGHLNHEQGKLAPPANGGARKSSEKPAPAKAPARASRKAEGGE